MRDAEVKHLDEAGFWIAGWTQCLHMLSTAEWTFYRMHPQWGSVLEGF